MSKIHPAISDLFMQCMRSNPKSDPEDILEEAAVFLDTLSELTLIASQTAPEALVAEFLNRR